MLVSSGWSTVGVSGKRVIIDVNENRMGTVLVDEKFLSRAQMSTYVNDDDDTITIRCRIHVFDNEEMDGITPHPPSVPPALTGDHSTDENENKDARWKPVNSRKTTRRDHSCTASTPAKRRRLQ